MVAINVKEESFSTSLLVEEIASLRKRVKELESDQPIENERGGFRSRVGLLNRKSANGNSSPGPSDQVVAALKKELADATTSKAEMEMDYLNILGKMEDDKRTFVELTKDLAEKEKLLDDKTKEIKQVSSKLAEKACRNKELEEEMREVSLKLQDNPAYTSDHSSEDVEKLKKELQEKANLIESLKSQTAGDTSGESRQADLQKAVSLRDVYIADKNKELVKFQSDLNESRNENDHLKAEMKALQEQVTDMKKTDSAPSSQEVGALNEALADTSKQTESLTLELTDVKQELQKSSELVKSLKSEILDLVSKEIGKAENNANSKQPSNAMEALQKGNKMLKEEAQNLRKKNETESKLVLKLKTEILELTKERIAYEESAFSKFDEQATKQRHDSDVEMQNLRKELTNLNMQKVIMEKETENRVATIESSSRDLVAFLKGKLEEQKDELECLQIVLDEKEDHVHRMEKEVEQLCGGMNSMAYSRRDELDDLQEEVMRITSTAASQTREIQSLKTQLEHCNHKHEAELAYLQTKLQQRTAGSPSNGMRAHMNEVLIQNLENEVKELKSCIVEHQADKHSLNERLSERNMGQQGSSRTLQVLRDRNSQLKHDVEKLTYRCKKLEKHVTRIAI
eukprot:scaffold66960_cov46-Attheya_sp.AAC.2